jgi:truncated hemoglobin YjbI
MLIPLLLLAVAAVAATAKPTTPAGGGQPPAPPKCELDAQIPPALAFQVLSYLEQASALVAQNASPAQKQALASVLDQAASGLSIGGYPKSAKCVSTAAVMLRAEIIAPSVPGVAPCELDAGIPPEMATQVLSYLEQAKQALPGAQKAALATSMEMAATPLEMSGFPKAAKCLRDAAQMLRIQSESSTTSLQRSNEAPLMLGDGTSMQTSSNAIPGIVINVTAKSKDA